MGWRGGRRASPAEDALLLPFWFASGFCPQQAKGGRAFQAVTEPAQKAAPAEGLGGEGCLLCGVERIAVDGAPWGLEEAGALGCSDSNSAGGNGAGTEWLLVSNTPILKAIT